MSFNLCDYDWAESLLQSFDRARSLTVAILLRYQEWEQIVDLSIDPRDYLEYQVDDFRFDYQSTELLRKVTFPIGIDTRKPAIDSFWAAEKQCHLTNQRLYKYVLAQETGFHYGTNPNISKFIECVRLEVKTILGDIPRSLDLKFSSGSTYDDRKFITPMDKMSSQPTITRDAIDVIVPFWSETSWAKGLCAEFPNRSRPRVIRGNRFTTVPKSAKTDRGICVEPSLNVTHQLSVGSCIRKALRRTGIDLRFGQDLHQKLVSSASMTRNLATIDLSSASDTVSYNVVKLFLPQQWFELLDALRSPETRIDGVWHRNAKFSSMGNGFTFELETLIFLAMARVFYGSSQNISVYGDDIIVPDALALNFVTCLQYFGFSINKRKTFIGAVPFRESCGADYFNGVPVRGYYHGDHPNDAQDWRKLANGIYRMAQYERLSGWGLGTYAAAWLRCVNHIPKAQRNYGPSHYGESVIHSDDESRYNIRWRNQCAEIKLSVPYYTTGSYSEIDREIWTRDSIVATAINQYFRGEILRRRRGTGGVVKASIVRCFLKPRPEVQGFKFIWSSYGRTKQPAWVHTLTQPKRLA